MSRVPVIYIPADKMKAAILSSFHLPDRMDPRITGNSCIFCNYNHIVTHGLCNEKPVKRISVDQRERFHFVDFMRKDGDQRYPVCPALLFNFHRVRENIDFLNGLFDPDFPKRHDTYKETVAVFQKISCIV